MLNLLTFTNHSFESIDFNKDLLTLDPDVDWKLPVKKFQTSGDVRTTKRTKPQGPGIFRSPTYIGQGSIHLEGDVLADTVGEANATRMNFFRILFGDPTLPQLRTLGNLTLDLMDIGQTFSTPLG